MAEEEQGAQPAGQAEGVPNGADAAEPERDWKAEYERLLKHSRTWEDKAKRLKEKADRYDELEESSKTDAERLADATRRAEDAEARLSEYERRAERAGVVAEVAKAKGVDAELLARMSGDGREEVEANADLLAERMGAASLYPSVPDAGRKAAGPVTRDEIESIKDPRERVRMRARHIDLYK